MTEPTDAVLAAARVAVAAWEQYDYALESTRAPRDPLSLTGHARTLALLLTDTCTALAHEQMHRQAAGQHIDALKRTVMHEQQARQAAETERDLARTEIAAHHAVFATLEAERDTAAARVAELEADVLRLEQQRYADRHALPEDPLLEAIPEKDAQ